MELAFLGNVFSLSIILASNAVAVFSGRLGEDGERKAGGNVRPKADTWLFFGFPRRISGADLAADARRN
jgi:hypothetical protein